jgi:hypothetical protein
VEDRQSLDTGEVAAYDGEDGEAEGFVAAETGRSVLLR